jgi:hypothetical protein
VPAVLDWSVVEWDRERHPERPEVILGGYRRGSTYGQKDGWRFQETLGDLKALVFAKGWGVLLFDEGIKSGQSIAAREKMPVLLDYLRAGLLHGIVAPDIKRLTRDTTMVDGIEIARVLQARRGMLVTGRRIWDLRDRFDQQAYRREVFQAGEEIISIRNTFYEGMEDRAQAVVRGDAPPFFRGPAAVGYRSVVCYWPKQTGEGAPKWVTEELKGTGPMTHRGVVIRTWVKDDAMGATLEAVHEELLRQPTIGEVARALNMRGIASPWRIRGADQRYGWSAKLIRQILKHPIYWGRWQWIYHQSEDTDLWWSFDGGLHADFPALAYWTEAEAAEFRTRFVDNYSPRRQSKYAHPWVGLGACLGCGGAFIGAGRDQTTKGQGAKLRCPEYRTPERCPAGAPFMIEDGIRRALDAHFPDVVVQLEGLRDRALTQAAQLKANPVAAQLEALDRRERGLLALAEDPSSVTPQMRTEFREISEARVALQQRLGEAQATDALLARAAALADLLEHDTVAVYEQLEEVDKAVLWRLLLTDEQGKVHPLQIQRVTKGNGLTPAKYRVLTPHVAQENDVWMLPRDEWDKRGFGTRRLDLAGELAARTS